MSENKDLNTLPLEELRRRWAEAWGKEPHVRIGRTMLIKSLEHKLREAEVGVWAAPRTTEAPTTAYKRL